MLVDCVEQCPDDLWASPNPRCDDGDRIIFRAFWRIAFHTTFFTHLYLGQNEAAFQPAPAHLAVRQRDDLDAMWQAPWDIEPYELPEFAGPSSKQDILDYIAFIKTLIDTTVDSLDLESNESGFSWYKNISKLSHQLLNLRHIQGHVGQLSELLFARNIDTGWVSQGQR
ncbi:MAG: hypothetical protein ABL949_07415 [Fimbriimonadaceae bacterium]